MKLNDREKQAIKNHTMGAELITDLDSALNILNIHGEECEYAIHPSIREEAIKRFQEKT